MSGRFSVNTAKSSDCLRDHFLLAMPGLSEGIFSQSITYICEHGESGAMGLVINQPLDLSVAEIFEHLQITPSSDFSKIPVMAGGPVQIDHGFVLHRNCTTAWEASLKVTPEITLTTSCDILRAIANNDGPGDHLIALGYAGWAAGQLEQEHRCPNEIHNRCQAAGPQLPFRSRIVMAEEAEYCGAAADQPRGQHRRRDDDRHHRRQADQYAHQQDAASHQWR